MRPKVSFDVPKAERTILVPGYVADGEVVYFTREQFDALEMEWSEFFEKARANASAQLDKLKPEFFRNKKKVIEYAELKSDSPLTATVVFAPEFLKRFEDIFGSKILVAIPNRYTVYVFPKLASTYQRHAPTIIGAYHRTTHPEKRKPCIGSESRRGFSSRK